MKHATYAVLLIAFLIAALSIAAGLRQRRRRPTGLGSVRMRRAREL